MNQDIFWIYNPSVLLKKYWEVIPDKNMTTNEKLNALTRLFITIFILLCLFSNMKQFIVLFIVSILLICVYYFIYHNNNQLKEMELIDKNKNEWTNYVNTPDKITSAIDDVYDSYKNDNFKGPNKNVEIESGYINSNGEYEINKMKNKNVETKKIVSFDENNLIKEKIDKKPTVENPFMNVVFSDFLDKNNYPQSANVYDSQIQETSQKLYNSNIFRSVADVFERENAQRNFYTVPSNITPESQTNFANWLYKTGPTCKENTSSCTYYEEPYMTSQRY